MLPESIEFCRTCLAPGKVLVSIYGEEESTSGPGSIAEMIGNITNVLPEKSDGLPNLVCVTCSTEIVKYHLFKLKCIKSEYTLRKMLKGDENYMDDLVAKEEETDYLNDVSIKSEEPSCSYIIRTIDEGNQTNFSLGEESKEKLDQVQPMAVLVKDEPVSCEELDQNNNSENEEEPGKTSANEENTSLSLEVVQKGGKGPLPKIKCPKCDRHNYSIVSVIVNSPKMLPESIEFCRTCLAPGKVLVSIYGEEESTSGPGSIAEMIGNITNVLPEKSDGLPNLVCVTCSTEIVKYHLFKLKCIKSEYTLRKMLKGDENYMDDLVAKEEETDYLNDVSIKSEEPSCSYIIRTIDEGNQTNFSLGEESKEKLDQVQPMAVLVKDEPVSCEELDQNNNSENEEEPGKTSANEENTSLSLEVVQKGGKGPLPKIKCPKCDRLYTHLARLKRHMRNHNHSNEEVNFTCSLCGKCYNRRYSLQRHMTTHKSFQNKEPLANKDSIATTEITKEIEDNITAKEQNQTQTELTKPIDKNLKSLEEMRQCNRCKKVCENEEALALHKKTHVKEKPHACHLCNKAFTFSHHLKIHLMNHNKIKPFKCEQCDQRFVRNSCLTRHLRTHTGDRPFPCEFCDKRFGHMYGLKLHRLVHTDERPYSCSSCSMRFKFPGTLRDHLRTHTGVKLYACQICPRKLSSKMNLRIHMKTHEKPVENAVEHPTTHNEEALIKYESSQNEK